jgi:hypothetical protein
MSALGAARCPRIADKEGIIVGGGRYTNSFRILFDGSKSPVSLHRNYIEQVVSSSAGKNLPGVDAVNRHAK